jgi:hypothetical protein
LTPWPDDLLVVSRVVVVLRARRDVVDLDVVLFFVSPVLVVFIKTADRTFLDRTFGTTIGIFARLLAFVFRWRIRTEIAIARGAGRPAAVRPRRPSTWARSKAACTTRSSAGAGSSIAARTWGTGWTLLAGSSFAHRQRASLEGLLIESADRGFRDRTIRVVDERESAWPPGFTVDRKNNLGGFTDAGEMLA